MPVLVVVLVPVAGREADWASGAAHASEFLRDISSVSLVRKPRKALSPSRPSRSWEGAKERLNLLSDPTFLCPLSGLLLDRGEFGGSNVLNRLLPFALVEGRLRILLRGMAVSLVSLFLPTRL